MSKKNQLIILLTLISFSIFCALIIGESWDEGTNLIIGKITLEYLFSFGRINNEVTFREIYSPLYWLLQSIFIKVFPFEYKVQVTHIINLIFSFGVVFGISKLSKQLFNKDIGRIVFLLLFFYPIFFGHMSMNSKDTILAFSHVWIFYYLIKYIKNQDINRIRNYCIAYIGVLAALANGIQILFLGSTIPIFLFLILEVFYFKKFSKKKISLLKLLFDALKCFLIFYFVLIIFWIDAHENILLSPYKILLSTMSDNFWTGWPFNLMNGDYFISTEVPKNYLIINLLYKSPEFFLILYPLFFIFVLKNNNYFKRKFKNFYYKILIILLFILFPNVILIFLPYPVYDGIRLFLWSIPYLCIMPALAIYYIYENINFLSSKILSAILFSFAFYFLYFFIMLSPYQYTYLNLLNGDSKTNYSKFENDYWGVSLKELINQIDLDKDKTIIFSTCGANHGVVKKYLLKAGYNNIKFSSPEDSTYIIMTNRVIDFNGFSNCFDRYNGKDIFKVVRNGKSLSIIRKIN